MAFRQLEVLLELIRVKKTTMQQLAERFEVSTKTIAHDIERLSASGFPVRCERGREGGILIDPAFKLDKSTLTPSDISDIVLAMHLLAGIRGKQRAGGVLTKLAMAIPELTLETTKTTSSDTSTSMPPKAGSNQTARYSKPPTRPWMTSCSSPSAPTAEHSPQRPWAMSCVPRGWHSTAMRAPADTGSLMSPRSMPAI